MLNSGVKPARAIISVSNKKGIINFSKHLLNHKYAIYSTGGTFNYLNQIYSKPMSNNIYNVNKVTCFPEILGGRIKTLHPNIIGGILADVHDNNHLHDIKQHNISSFSLVVANLYPFCQRQAEIKQRFLQTGRFRKMVAMSVDKDSNEIEGEIIENIDIGGHTMIRAAAKNFKNVSVLVDPKQYSEYINRENNGKITYNYRRDLAAYAMSYIDCYDRGVSEWFNPQTKWISLEKIRPLKYGINPTNLYAGLYSIDNKEPCFDVINGDIGYINVLDAVGSWSVVSELRNALGRVACASFKHTIPTGVAVARTIKEIDSNNFTGITDFQEGATTIYKRARNCDPLSSFGDFIAISGKVDKKCAQYISKVVSDGIIARDYDDDALEILKAKKGGRFVVLRGRDIDFTDTSISEIRSVNGATVVQNFDGKPFNTGYLRHFVTEKRYITDDQRCDLAIASIAIRYAQSNSIGVAYKGQLIGIGSGQQNRLDCVRLACDKAFMWTMRHNNEVMDNFDLYVKEHEHHFVSNQDRLSALYFFIREHLDETVKKRLRREMAGLSLSSDGFIPFPDNIAEARRFGVTQIANPGGSNNDAVVIRECDKHGVAMCHTGRRLFFH
jgi:phosphoribosylaminoimidazolecarboxamide formyltransferase / IMP cyclohydrolase